MNLMTTCRISLWSRAMLPAKCRPKCVCILCLLTKNNDLFIIFDYFKGQRRCSEENWLFEHSLCLSPSQAESAAAAMCHMACVKNRPSAAHQQEDHTQGRTMKCHGGVAYWAMSARRAPSQRWCGSCASKTISVAVLFPPTRQRGVACTSSSSSMYCLYLCSIISLCHLSCSRVCWISWATSLCSPGFSRPITNLENKTKNLGFVIRKKRKQWNILHKLHMWKTWKNSLYQHQTWKAPELQNTPTKKKK